MTGRLKIAITVVDWDTDHNLWCAHLRWIASFFWHPRLPSSNTRKNFIQKILLERLKSSYLSMMVRVLSSLLGMILMPKFLLESSLEASVRLSNLILSRASLEFEINSLRKISLLL